MQRRVFHDNFWRFHPIVRLWICSSSKKISHIKLVIECLYQKVQKISGRSDFSKFKNIVNHISTIISICVLNKALSKFTTKELQLMILIIRYNVYTYISTLARKRSKFSKSSDSPNSDKTCKMVLKLMLTKLRLFLSASLSNWSVIFDNRLINSWPVIRCFWYSSSFWKRSNFRAASRVSVKSKMNRSMGNKKRNSYL